MHYYELEIHRKIVGIIFNDSKTYLNSFFEAGRNLNARKSIITENIFGDEEAQKVAFELIENSSALLNNEINPDDSNLIIEIFRRDPVASSIRILNLLTLNLRQDDHFIVLLTLKNNSFPHKTFHELFSITLLNKRENLTYLTNPQKYLTAKNGFIRRYVAEQFEKNQEK